MPLAYTRIPVIAAAAPAKVAQALAATAFRVEARAKQTAPVDTGNLRGSIGAEGGGLRWRVLAAAEYAVFVELGTRRMSAQPYLVPALRQETPFLIRALGGLV